MFSAEKLKPFLLHPERVVREFVVDYFKESFSKDPDLMSLVLRCCETFSEEKEVRHMLRNATQFIQTEETLSEIFARLAGDRGNRVYYENLIINTDLSLLDKYRNHLALLSGKGRKMVERRLVLKEMTAEELWRVLMDYGYANAGKYINGFTE